MATVRITYTDQYNEVTVERDMDSAYGYGDCRALNAEQTIDYAVASLKRAVLG